MALTDVQIHIALDCNIVYICIGFSSLLSFTIYVLTMKYVEFHGHWGS
jgi:hypothetical protein